MQVLYAPIEHVAHVRFASVGIVFDALDAFINGILGTA